MGAPDLDPRLLSQLQALRADFLYYAPRLLKIKAKHGSIIPFELNRAQKAIHARLEAQKREKGWVRALILKGRQQGVSTYVEGRFFHQTHLTFGRGAVVMAHQQDSTDALFEMVRRYHEHMPDALRLRTRAASTKELAFADMDSAYSVATAGSADVGRGWTMQLFHASEFAFWTNAQEHFAGIAQALPLLPGTEGILESTANGPGNVFHSMWRDAERGIGDYIAVFVPWFWQPEYRRDPEPDFEMTPDEVDYASAYKLDAEQIAWRREKIRTEFRGDEALFDQEYPAEPAVAFRNIIGDPLIPSALIVKARHPLQEVQASGPKILGLDPAEYGDDASVLISRQGRKAGDVYRRWYKLGPMEVVGRVAIEADRYGPDAINVDCTGIGSGIADRLTELGYPVNRVHAGERAIEPERYVIRRDEMWGDSLEWFRDPPNQIPDCDILAAELGSPQFTYDSSRRLKVESKEQMRKRGLPSPDGADALNLTHAVRIAPGAKSTAGELATRKRAWYT